MPRCAKQRFVQFPPSAVLFKPQGIPLRNLEQVTIGLDEYEILRLVDYEGLDIETAGESLRVSRATAGRILESARKKSAEALCRGKAILIEGGSVILGGRRYRCGACGGIWDAPGVPGDAGENLKAPLSCPICKGSEVTDLGLGWTRGSGPGGQAESSGGKGGERGGCGREGRGRRGR